MSTAFLAVAAALLYLSASGIQLLHLSQQRSQVARSVVGMGLIALLCHAIVAWDSVFSREGLNLGFYKVSALIFLVINVACIIALFRRPLQNLLIALFPLSAVAVLVSTFGPDTIDVQGEIGGGLMVHISSSILAYSVLTLAAAQAAVVAVQDYQLRHRHTRGIVRVLPPLQLMESMLFELLWVGVIMLTAAIASGMIFMEDMFAQHLVHKTVLTMVAWVLFSVLLWGHYQLGWRSQTAVRFTLAGFVVLMLAFFGSKLVLELVLQRP
jgi:ABC-type uncharacterized transport system permease subunit